MQYRKEIRMIRNVETILALLIDVLDVAYPSRYSTISSFANTSERSNLESPVHNRLQVSAHVDLGIFMT
jgi:hypothetical protein